MEQGVTIAAFVYLVLVQIPLWPVEFVILPDWAIRAVPRSWNHIVTFRFAMSMLLASHLLDLYILAYTEARKSNYLLFKILMFKYWCSVYFGQRRSKRTPVTLPVSHVAGAALALTLASYSDASMFYELSDTLECISLIFLSVIGNTLMTFGFAIYSIRVAYEIIVNYKIQTHIIPAPCPSSSLTRQH